VRESKGRNRILGMEDAANARSSGTEENEEEEES